MYTVSGRRTNRLLRARKALWLLNNVPLRTRRTLSPSRISTAIVPFWFSTVHCWIVIMPFSLSIDEMWSWLTLDLEVNLLLPILSNWLSLSRGLPPPWWCLVMGAIVIDRLPLDAERDAENSCCWGRTENLKIIYNTCSTTTCWHELPLNHLFYVYPVIHVNEVVTKLLKRMKCSN